MQVCLDNGLGMTPPMGWMTWERFECNIDCESYPDECINEKLILDHIDALVDMNFTKYGYEYVNIDDCWSALNYTEDGLILPDPDRFPRGIKYLGKKNKNSNFIADYAHSRGVKLGLYNDIGNKTCVGYPGLKGHEKENIELWASWGIDSLKVDGCYADVDNYPTDYPALSKIMNETGSWPAYVKHEDCPYKELAKYCNSWRNFDDIQDYWPQVDEIIQYWAQPKKSDLVKIAGPGAWNDPDMLVIGNFGTSPSQQQIQMAVWAIVAAPLMMGNDLRRLNKEEIDLLQNEEIIAVNQDRLGKQGYIIYHQNNQRIWARELENDEYAIVMEYPYIIGNGINMEFHSYYIPGIPFFTKFYARDLFAKKDMGFFRGHMKQFVNIQSCKMYRIKFYPTFKQYIEINQYNEEQLQKQQKQE